MLELRLVGIHEDGENLVLESADSTKFLLPIDQNLRTSIAKARRIQPVRGLSGSGVFGPREIQTRFRQGATVEEIVNESGWEAERVRKYEWPIIAERQHVIAAAQQARISDMNGLGNAFQKLSLRQRLGRVLAAWRLDENEQVWNTYQQESGQWTVTFEMTLTEEQRNMLPVNLLMPARWTYNPANQTIYASNDAAYFFMGRAADSSANAPAPLKIEEEPEQPKPVDFARHAEDYSKFPRTESLKAVRVPQDDVQEEILDELDSRRGTRDFASASERKLADLLERARSGSAEAQPPAPAEEVAEEKTEVEASAEVEEVAEVIAEPAPEQQTEVAEVTEAEIVEPAVEDGEQETFTSRAERRSRMMQRYLDSQQSDAESHEEEPVAEGETQTVQEEIEEKLQQVQSERDAAGSSWRSQHTQVKAAEAEEVKTSEESADAPVDAEATDADEEETSKPVRSTKPKRASVPSWDDIIFGSQRK